MAVPDPHLRQIVRWCEGRIPERALHQVRVECTVRASHVTIYEVRAPWADGPRRAIAQLRHDGSLWRLYGPDRNARWQPLPDVPPHSTPGPLLDVVGGEPGFW
ncbi:DUF3024 domain-containing protein [Allokutzneria albata]|uniref:DUF3024 domain-containing protein n=1 Tax=Allokutzneria albata TaxID=211114 RepID=A0A1G9RIZ5_ALLAB|nr:DUF3024 domain-containing protein [Allokutzneria albata]SDM22857.1 Protein of unknown function [Allokutzneria albata]